MNKLVGILGLAAASRNISIGETIMKDIRARKCKFVLIAEDASANTKKKLEDKCKYYQIAYGFIESSEVLSKAIGKFNVKAVGILDDGFANKIKINLKG
ncbi:ribosomal protein L7Ae-like RNA K-turn-binding protein [Breznakia sp. PF5-3]|uniref:L7Ae/L30e/S12e/Gadd45 family ribosomal protein n=1 Tax=unclassified Breznakia TaxID=2623764 RepID=UPI00240733C9|nr:MULTISPECIES: ribosomal L7Ae/L30e/S12e/Gadd45 family protein [unclassified Breznakia]MDF9824070.1 ribosomal protein L7Ae-like RNA K-turn-binding protein [Breznakia sp. PM6-1]MDF9834864.1 ribosomal protein L7Ae-like RNA K-turn-binding protein [Breznakia sp. PF5-3]MDF9837114.1 ribosomal protein L7Ae-like RNA K-turn-binding protein [Breznakia sp. PFB2-8]MDF9859039.1 ribosomal protein L7Ae-like RNA K-turn-binding protein [Breznakia sp. PH5-24]